MCLLVRVTVEFVFVDWRWASFVKICLLFCFVLLTIYCWNTFILTLTLSLTVLLLPLASFCLLDFLWKLHSYFGQVCLEWSLEETSQIFQMLHDGNFSSVLLSFSHSYQNLWRWDSFCSSCFCIALAWLGQSYTTPERVWLCHYYTH